jgi:hypothetical protein
MRGSQHSLRIRCDFSLHLLAQIEMLRGDFFHEELSRRLGDVTERYLARYVAGKVRLLERDFYRLAQAISIRPRVLAEQWAAACGVRVPSCLSDKDAVEWIRQRAYCHWRQRSQIARLPANRVPPDPSPMTIIREKYADILLAKHRASVLVPTALRSLRRREGSSSRGLTGCWCSSFMTANRKGPSEPCTALVESARQVMVSAAYAWARRAGIDLIGDRSVPFKNDAKLVKNLYVGLRFYAERQFAELETEGI